MDLLRLDESLSRLPGMSDLQPNADQLMVLVHHKENQAVIGARALSLSLGFSQARVEKIKRNLAERKSALEGVFTSLFGPLSYESLTGEVGPSDVVPTVTSVNTLSTTFATTVLISSVTVEDYVVPDEDAQPKVQGAGGSSIGDAMDRELTEEDFNFSGL